MLDGILADEQMYLLVVTPVLSYLWLLKNRGILGCRWLQGPSNFAYEETIFKDQSFDHPYFLTYFNTCGSSATSLEHHWNLEFPPQKKDYPLVI